MNARKSHPVHPDGIDLALFGELVRKRRLDKRLTLHGVSERTGVSLSALSELENGRKFTLVKASLVCRLLGIRLSSLIFQVERDFERRHAEQSLGNSPSQTKH
ncbi:MAG: XRE family transcriptional regulator [Burkholderiaceae bacterium]|nr:MAG: XRE family transcriptional regulator [Burkholderiaceae bacterium]TBR76842.1 MAG: XRE family transcriptional regulator [Burkholderiaceae bacterium]